MLAMTVAGFFTVVGYAMVNWLQNIGAASNLYGSKASSEAGDPAARGSRIAGLADGTARQHMFNSNGMSAMTATSWYNQSGAYSDMKANIAQQHIRGLLESGNIMDMAKGARENISAHSAAASAARMAQLGNSPESIAKGSGMVSGQDAAKQLAVANYLDEEGKKRGLTGEEFAAGIARIDTGKNIGEKLSFAEIAESNGMKPDELAYRLGRFGSEKSLQGVNAAETMAKAANMSLEDYLRSSQSIGAYVDPKKGEVRQAIDADGKVVYESSKKGKDAWTGKKDIYEDTKKNITDHLNLFQRGSRVLKEKTSTERIDGVDGSSEKHFVDVPHQGKVLVSGHNTKTYDDKRVTGEGVTNTTYDPITGKAALEKSEGGKSQSQHMDDKTIHAGTVVEGDLKTYAIKQVAGEDVADASAFAVKGVTEVAGFMKSMVNIGKGK